MDFFGIGHAMNALVQVYSMSARRTGRTTTLVNNLKDGDRVVFMNQLEADRVKRLCREKNIDIRCEVVDPKFPGRLFGRPQSKCRTIFDHSWVEEYYRNAIQKAQFEIKRFETESGGWGEAHKETMETALSRSEFLKWRI